MACAGIYYKPPYLPGTLPENANAEPLRKKMLTATRRTIRREKLISERLGMHIGRLRDETVP